MNSITFKSFWVLLLLFYRSSALGQSEYGDNYAKGLVKRSIGESDQPVDSGATLDYLKMLTETVRNFGDDQGLSEREMGEHIQFWKTVINNFLEDTKFIQYRNEGQNRLPIILAPIITFGMAIVNAVKAVINLVFKKKH